MRTGEKIALLAIIVTIVLAIGGYGFANRPIVGYNIVDPPDIIYNVYDSSYYYNSPISQDISLWLSNSGETDASLLLDFKCMNATISNVTTNPIYFINNNEAQISAAIPKGIRDGKFKITIEINRTTDSFYCRYDAMKNKKDDSLSGLINTVFGEMKPYYPTDLNYKKIGRDFVRQK